MKRRLWTTSEVWVTAAAAMLIGSVTAWALAPRPLSEPLARYVTTVRGRTPNQVHNAALAARSIHGRVILPGEVFSFNQLTGSWSSDSGYRLAPVSFDGELVPGWGGGVCQTSSTLYNAALLAGMTILERHRHQWIPRYVPAGRDAAVAWSSIDLKFRNDLAFPVQVEAEVRGDLLRCGLVAARRPERTYSVEQDTLGGARAAVVEQPWNVGLGYKRVKNPGRDGRRVRTYRITRFPSGETKRELLSDDRYPAMNRLVLVR